MMTVRMPNGQAVQYNNAGYVVSHGEYTDIYRRKGGDRTGEGWVAQVPNTCIIESEIACRVYDPLQQQPLEQLIKEVRALRRKVTKK